MSDQTDPKQEMDLAVEALTEGKNADIYVLSSAMYGNLDEAFLQESERKRSKAGVAYIFIATYGGSPDAAFQIARCLERHYKRVVACIDGPCLSAGTLLALGANEVVMTDYAQLGPLDIQLRKRDELDEMSSGLTGGMGLDALRKEAYLTFDQFYNDLKRSTHGGVTLTTAMEVAAKMTIGLFGPIYGQFDPQKIGEDERAMRITEQYGQRLLGWSRNAKVSPDLTLARLISGCPSHGYVIDREETATLLKNVRPPDDIEQQFLTLIRQYVRDEADDSVVKCIPKKSKQDEREESESKDDESNGSPAHPDEGGAGDERGPGPADVGPDPTVVGNVQDELGGEATADTIATSSTEVDTP